MNIYQIVKSAVTTRQAAERYGLEVRYSGMALCPFHEDRHPSLKVDRRFYCFGCGASGDVIDFTSKLYGLSLYDAAHKLASDFGLDNNPPQAGAMKPRLVTLDPRREERRCLDTLLEYQGLLEDWRGRYFPASPGAPPDERYVEACRMLAPVTWLVDELSMGYADERAAAMRVLTRDGCIDRLRRHLRSVIDCEQIAS